MQQLVLNMCFNSTGWDDKTDSPIIGGQNDVMTTTTFEYLDNAGVEYTVSRQPRYGAINVYYSNRDRYVAGSRQYDFVSVLFSHGVADKRYYRDQKSRAFDYIMIPGFALHQTITQYQGVPYGKSLVAGVSKLDPLFHTQRPANTTGKIRVLYAPTHGGGGEQWTEGNRSAPGARATSWWYRDEIMDVLKQEDDFEVTLAPHPRHSPGNQSTLWQYHEADVVIVDGGSTIYESMALGLPIVVPSWLTSGRNLERGRGGTTVEAQFYAGGYGVHVPTMDDLVEGVRSAYASGPSERDTEFAERCVPSFTRGRSGELRGIFLEKLVRGGDVSDLLH